MSDIPHESTEPSAAEAVTRHLDAALDAAREAQMSTSELVGLFFYYAHAIAASYRESLMAAGSKDASS